MLLGQEFIILGSWCADRGREAFLVLTFRRKKKKVMFEVEGRCRVFICGRDVLKSLTIQKSSKLNFNLY